MISYWQPTGWELWKLTGKPARQGRQLFILLTSGAQVLEWARAATGPFGNTHLPAEWDCINVETVSVRRMYDVVERIMNSVVWNCLGNKT